MSSLARKLSFSQIVEDEIGTELANQPGGHNLSPPTMSVDLGNLRRIPVGISMCKAKKVCVFGDRAQVERLVEIEVVDQKENDDSPASAAATSAAKKQSVVVVISDVPQGSDNTSIRVALLTGEAIILEVAIENVTKEVLRETDADEQSKASSSAADEEEKPPAEDDKEAALKKKQEQDEKKRKTVEEILMKEKELQEEMARLEKERVWLEQYATQQSSPNSGVKLALDTATTFLTYYTDNLLRLDTRIDAIQEELQKLADRRNNLVEVRSVKSVYLLLGDASGALSFSLSYLMYNAMWKPAYDIRVQSNKTSSIELTYHGIITNSTGEHWKDVELSLSTAQPQVGGGPPPLRTLTAHFPRPVYQPRKRLNKMMDMSVKRSARSSSVTREEEEESGNGDGAPAILLAEAKESATSTSFAIPRRATINSDNQPHKVTIDILDLNGTFSHTIIPKSAQHAYLRSKSTNTSNYPFLAGKANVFMDDTYVATSELKTTNPGEDITLYLGSDPTVVVEFKESFFKSSKGLMSKSNQAKYQHDITVKNTKGAEISCDIFDQLPKSQEDKVKVTVLRPQIEDREREGGCTLVPQNNSLHWRVKVAPGKQFDAVFEYQIDYPGDKLIDFMVA